MRRKASSVFKEFGYAYADVQANPNNFGGTKKALLEELKMYFNSFEWASTEREKVLFMLSMQDKPAKEKAYMLGISEGSYNTMSSRVTAEINDVLFDGMGLEQVVYGQDEEVVTKALKKVFFLNRRKESRGTYSEEILSYISRFSIPNKEVTEPDQEEVIRAINLLSMYSVDAFTFMLNRINPDVLGYVLDKIRVDSPSNELFIYDLARQRFKEQLEDKTKEFIQGMEKQMQDYEIIMS